MPTDDTREFRSAKARRLVDRRGSLAEVARSMKDMFSVV
jgi:hypothetical protein